MQPKPPCPAPAHWWWTWASGLLLRWQLQLGTILCLFVYLFFPPGYVALWDSKTPYRPAYERVSYCVETPSWLPPQDGSPSLTLSSLLLSFIFCPTSFQREWAAFLGAWCPLPALRSCFVEVGQRSNDIWWICGGESCLPILFLCHLGTTPLKAMFFQLPCTDMRAGP